MSHVNFRNVLVLLGIIVTTIGLGYFATEFLDVISQWGRVLDLALLGVLFIGLGVHFEGTPDSTEVVSRSGWRWLSAKNALYILGAVSTFGAVIAFLAIDDLERIYKVLVTLTLGLALILVAARRFKPPTP